MKRQEQLFYDEMVTPIGEMCIMSDNDAIIRIDFGTLEQVKEKANHWFHRYFTERTFLNGHQLISDMIIEIEQYFSEKHKSFSVPYKLYGTPFQKSVWKATADNVAYGETKSYKEIGEILDNVKAVRAIGGALNQNPCSIIVPCHRVIGATGKMTGYGGGLDKKSYLLTLEQ